MLKKKTVSFDGPSTDSGKKNKKVNTAMTNVDLSAISDADKALQEIAEKEEQMRKKKEDAEKAKEKSRVRSCGCF